MWTPMSADDVLDALKEHGVPEGVALSILSLLGMNVRVHDKKAFPRRPFRR
jgi:hypothetical protein